MMSFPEKDERPVLRLLAWILALDEVIPWYSGYQFTGLNLSKRDNDWLLVVRAKRGKGESVVSFHTGHRPWYCFHALAYAVKTNQMGWRPDRFNK